MPDKLIGILTFNDKKEPVLTVSWEQQTLLIKKVLAKIMESKYKPKLLICIATGGLFSGPIMARTLNIPYAVWMAQHWDDKDKSKGGDIRKKVSFAKNIVFISPDGEKCELTTGMVESDFSDILLHDDLAHTGGTFHEAERLLRDQFGKQFNLKSSCLWHKSMSNYYVHFIGQLIEPETSTGEYPWITQPHEDTVDKLKVELAPQLEEYNKL
jgi:hypoxanthine phosphoribosyltransferase